MAVDHPRERDERNPTRIVGTARLHLPLHIQGQLLSQEQILRGELRMGSCRCRRQSTPSWSRRTARPSKAAVITTSCCSSTTPERAPARPRRSPSAISTFDPMGLDQCGSSARGQDAICPLWPATMTSLRALTHGRSPDEPVFRNRRRTPVTRFVVHDDGHTVRDRCRPRVPVDRQEKPSVRTSSGTIPHPGICRAMWEAIRAQSEIAAQIGDGTGQSLGIVLLTLQTVEEAK